MTYCGSLMDKKPVFDTIECIRQINFYNGEVVRHTTKKTVGKNISTGVSGRNFEMKDGVDRHLGKYTPPSWEVYTANMRN